MEPEKPLSATVEAGAAFEALAQVQAIVATRNYIELVHAGALTLAEAGRRLAALADDIESMTGGAPVMFRAVAVPMREYAALFQRGTVPSLRLVKSDD